MQLDPNTARVHAELLDDGVGKVSILLLTVVHTASSYKYSYSQPCSLQSVGGTWH